MTVEISTFGQVYLIAVVATSLYGIFTASSSRAQSGGELIGRVTLLTATTIVWILGSPPVVLLWTIAQAMATKILFPDALVFQTEEYKNNRTFYDIATAALGYVMYGIFFLIR